MLESSTREKSKARDSSSGKMAHFMRAALLTASSLASANTISQTSTNSMTVNFASVRWKDVEWRHGQMAVAMKEISSMGKRMVRAPSTGQVARPTSVAGVQASSMASE